MNPALTAFTEGVRDVRQGWLVVLSNHNKVGDAAAQLAEVQARLTQAGFRTAEGRQFTGVQVVPFARAP